MTSYQTKHILSVEHQELMLLPKKGGYLIAKGQKVVKYPQTLHSGQDHLRHPD